MSPRFILEKMQQGHLGNWHDPAHQLFLAGLRKSGLKKTFPGRQTRAQLRASCTRAEIRSYTPGPIALPIAQSPGR